jgi:NhaP-type Na+/H+ or K+/H+ antiporter
MIAGKETLMTTPLSTITLAAFALVILVTTEAYAYLDLGTGSFILQMLLGLAFGALLGVKFYWQKIKNRLNNIGSVKSSNDSSDGE